MTEPTPTPANGNTVLLVLLLLAMGALVYLDWRKSGEIENLHARLDQLVPPAPLRTTAPPPAAPSPTVPTPPPAPVFVGDEVLPGSVPVDEHVVVENNGPHPLIRSVLQAHTDNEVDAIGRDQ
jgi:hypothetical protein